VFSRVSWNQIAISLHERSFSVLSGLTIHSRHDEKIGRKSAQVFRLGWFIMTAVDREAGKNREAALVQGYSDLIPADAAEHGGRTKPFYFEVLKAARPLIKNGILTGTYAFRIRLSEAIFDDGSSWNESQTLATHRKSSRAHHLSSFDCPNDICTAHENGQLYCGEAYSAGSKLPATLM